MTDDAFELIWNKHLEFEPDELDKCLLIIDGPFQHTELFVRGYEVKEIVKSAVRKKDTDCSVFVHYGTIDPENEKT